MKTVAQSRDIDVEDFMEILRTSIEKALKKDKKKTVSVKFNTEKNTIFAYTQELVVEDVEAYEEESEYTLISLEDAKLVKKSIKVGDVLEQQISFDDISRVAAKGAQSTLNSDLKSLERKKAYEYFKALEGEMIDASIAEVTEKNYVILLRMGASSNADNKNNELTTILPKNEILKGDDFAVGDKTKVYIKKVEETTKDPKIFVSRSDKNLVKRLLELHIPEIKDGTIEIKGISRDPGDRCKIAIYSNDANVDALGSCVGQAGERIKSVVEALSGEKIDLYKWSENPEELIANSLQPARVSKVLNIDVKEKKSLAIVPDDQLSLAIGKNGQNVRLAVVSCGWKIDIKPLSEAYEEKLVSILEG